jgi:DNA-binding response OmpR family regulator
MAMSRERPGVILLHDDEAIVDLLRGLFEAHGYVVDGCTMLDAAIDCVSACDPGAVVIVTAWDRGIGQSLWHWVGDQRRELRHRLVFVVDEITEDMSEVAARGRIVPLADLAGLLDAMSARLGRAAPPPQSPRLLLAEDDPDQLVAMTEILGDEGFEVHPVAGGRAAIELLEETTFDAVLSDWVMPDGSGAELFAWIARSRPDLLGNLVFITGGDLAPIQAQVGSVAVLPKGQDSPALLALLRRPRGLRSVPLSHVTVGDGDWEDPTYVEEELELAHSA